MMYGGPFILGETVTIADFLVMSCYYSIVINPNLYCKKLGFEVKGHLLEHTKF